MAELAPQLARSRHLSGITLGELAKHNSPQNAWVAVDGVVYDASDFVERHPGQVGPLLAHAGEDITPFFDAFHSAGARRVLASELETQPAVRSRDLHRAILRRRGGLGLGGSPPSAAHPPAQERYSSTRHMRSYLRLTAEHMQEPYANESARVTGRRPSWEP